MQGFWDLGGLKVCRYPDFSLWELEEGIKGELFPVSKSWTLPPDYLAQSFQPKFWLEHSAGKLILLRHEVTESETVHMRPELEDSTDDEDDGEEDDK